MKHLLCVLLVVLWVATAHAEPALNVPGSVDRGQAFMVELTSELPLTDVRLSWLERELPVVVRRSEQGGYRAVALLGTDVKRKGRDREIVSVSAKIDGQGAAWERRVEIHEREYPEQRLRVDAKMASPPESVWPRIKRERGEVLAALEAATPERRWELPLFNPVDARVSSVYGLRRFFNDQPRSPHRGLDLAAPTGTPVAAVADGVVVLTGNHYFAGRSVYVNHGTGVVSAYFHLSEIGVAQGDEVRAGDVLGKVGESGRVTGAHLHFGLYVLGQAVDPEPLFAEPLKRKGD